MTPEQRAMHWRRDGGKLWIHLEAMWDDFEYSLDRFIEALRTVEARRTAALGRWRKSRIEIISATPGQWGGATAMIVTASAAPSNVTQTTPPVRDELPGEPPAPDELPEPDERPGEPTA